MSKVSRPKNKNIEHLLQIVVSGIMFLLLGLLIYQWAVPSKTAKEEAKAQRVIPQKQLEATVLEPIVTASIQLPPPPELAIAEPAPDLQKVLVESKPQKALKPTPENTESTKRFERLKPTKFEKTTRIDKLEGVAEVIESLEEEVGLENELRTAQVSEALFSSKTFKPQAAATKIGGSLLKLLEHGTGPQIHLFWPTSSEKRNALYDHLIVCHGMVTAYLSGERFYRDGQRKAWALNADYYSGFLREPAGRIPANEDLKLHQMRSQHSLGSNIIHVRVFPRLSDKKLLGGLHQVIGQDYASKKNITAEYYLNGRSLIVKNITADGITYQDEISLPSVLTGCMRT